MSKKKLDENYLEKIPARKEGLNWSKDENGMVTLEMENKGAVNKVAQFLFRKPKISYIHLEEFGSFIWPIIDGKKTIFEIGKEVEEHFGEKAYFSMLERYEFVTLK